MLTGQDWYSVQSAKSVQQQQAGQRTTALSSPCGLYGQQRSTLAEAEQMSAGRGTTGHQGVMPTNTPVSTFQHLQCRHWPGRGPATHVTMMPMIMTFTRESTDKIKQISACLFGFDLHENEMNIDIDWIVSLDYLVFIKCFIIRSKYHNQPIWFLIWWFKWIT